MMRSLRPSNDGLVMTNENKLLPKRNTDCPCSSYGFFFLPNEFLPYYFLFNFFIFFFDNHFTINWFCTFGNTNETESLSHQLSFMDFLINLIPGKRNFRNQ